MKTPLQRSQAQEKRIAASHGGTVNSGSGNGIWRKNDVRSAEWSIEAKRTDKRSYSLKIDELLKAEKYAVLDNRRMAFYVEIGTRSFVVIAEEDFDELRGA